MNQSHEARALLAVPLETLSFFGKLRWNLLAALFAALVLVALTVRRWRCAEIVEPIAGKTQSTPRPIAMAAVPILLAVAGVLAWGPPSSEDASADVMESLVSDVRAAGADQQGPSEPFAVDSVHVDGECLQCGIVESAREISPLLESIDQDSADLAKRSTRNTTPVNGFEITVRTKDGATHRFMAANASTWRPGERVIFIDGRSAASN